VIGPREYPCVDFSREALHDQAAGSRESCEFIYFEHHWALQPFSQQHAAEHEVGMSFIEHSIRLAPQDWQQPEWEKQVVEKLEYLKNELRTLATYVFPKSLEPACMTRFAQKWHHSGGFQWIYAWRGYHRHFVAIGFQCFHQAANVHGLGTTAHGAMVVDELHDWKLRKIRERAAGISTGPGENHQRFIASGSRRLFF
jgi:hypothetical protein